MGNKKRDIYKKVGEPGFNLDRDVDLEYLRRTMETEKLSDHDYNMFGLFARNIIQIVQNDYHFRGYPDYLKEDMMSESLLDVIKARTKFKGKDYPNKSAPFYYLWRIAFNACARVCDHYYKMQSKMIPASLVGANVRTSSGEPFDGDIIEKAPDWSAVIENLLS